MSKRDDLLKGFAEGVGMYKEFVDEIPPADVFDIGMEAARTAIAPFVWAKAVGDRFDTGTVQGLLGVSRQALAKRVANGSLLGLPGKNTTYYPKWQFDLAKKAVRPEVRRILHEFIDRGEDDAYMIATWMMTSNRELDSATPASWLEDGKEVGRLFAAVRETAGRWAS